VSPPVLAVRDLTVELDTPRGRVPVVAGVGFDVHAGETVAIVGESGAGKSVAAMALLGLLPSPPFAVTSGSAVLDGGDDLLALDRRSLRRVRGGKVGMIFQDPLAALNPVFTVGAQVGEAVRLHERGVRRGALRERVIRLLGSVQIPDPALRAGQYPHEYSGGMRQRAMITMAVANRPRLLVADEPTTALDVTVQAHVLEVLRERQAGSGAGLVLITHDLGVVAELADRVLTMYAGRIVESAPVETALAAPRHPYTIGLLRSVPRIEAEPGDLAVIPGGPPRLGEWPAGCAFRARCPVGRAEPLCADRDPALAPVAPGHDVACHFSDRTEARL
jgi:oligopeptide/dipeptide ABC transporter ATP-binding protein